MASWAQLTPLFSRNSSSWCMVRSLFCVWLPEVNIGEAYCMYYYEQDLEEVQVERNSARSSEEKTFSWERFGDGDLWWHGWRRRRSTWCGEYTKSRWAWLLQEKKSFEHFALKLSEDCQQKTAEVLHFVMNKWLNEILNWKTSLLESWVEPLYLVTFLYWVQPAPLITFRGGIPV